MAEPDPDCLTNYHNTRVNDLEYLEVDSNNAQELQMTWHNLWALPKRRLLSSSFSSLRDYQHRKFRILWHNVDFTNNASCMKKYVYYILHHNIC